MAFGSADTVLEFICFYFLYRKKKTLSKMIQASSINSIVKAFIKIIFLKVSVLSREPKKKPSIFQVFDFFNVTELSSLLEFNP